MRQSNNGIGEVKTDLLRFVAAQPDPGVRSDELARQYEVISPDYADPSAILPEDQNIRNRRFNWVRVHMGYLKRLGLVDCSRFNADRGKTWRVTDLGREWLREHG